MRLALTLATAAVAAATLGLSSAQAQDAPAFTGPYHLISFGRDALVFTATGTVQKSGNMASVTVITGSNPSTLAETGFARLDMRYQFNCRDATYKTPVFAAYNADGGLVGALDDDKDWEAVNPEAASAIIMELACNGTIPADSELNSDPDTIVAIYRDSLTDQ